MYIPNAVIPHRYPRILLKFNSRTRGNKNGCSAVFVCAGLSVCGREGVRVGSGWLSKEMMSHFPFLIDSRHLFVFVDC